MIPQKPAGETGGTMHPMYRKVLGNDIKSLKLEKLQFNSGISIVGTFTNFYHNDHAQTEWPGDLA